MVYLVGDSDDESEDKGRSEKKRRTKKRPLSCFFPSDLLQRLETIAEDAHRQRTTRQDRHRATQTALRQRMASVLRQLNVRSRSAFLLHRSTADPLLQDPLAPFLPGLWARGQLPVQSKDHRVLLRLFTWLQGMALRLENISAQERRDLKCEVAATLTREEEMTAVGTLLHQCKACNSSFYRVANHVLEDDKMFREYAVRRAVVEREQGMVNTISSMKDAVVAQLNEVLGAKHPYLKIILESEKAKKSVSNPVS